MLVNLLLLAACAPGPAAEPGVMTVVNEQTSAWVRNFNPLGLNSRFPTLCGIYEPLMVYNPMRDVWTPWLAEEYRYRDPVTLVFTLREGVQWSDGAPFDAEDVAFSFGINLENPALDLGGVGRFLDRVEIEGPHTVVFHLERPYGPGFETIAHRLIVPEHVVRHVDDPLLWTNPDPVGTGPFTEVRTFRSQVFELGRNPYYWQGEVGPEVLRFPALGSNDQVAMGLIQGEVDWAGAFVPQIDEVYVAADPASHHYWHPEGPSWFLYPNTGRPPFDDVRVRKAISLALDRELMLEVAGWRGFVGPSRGTGLTDLFAGWRDPDAEAAADWVEHDRTRAADLLDDAGLRIGEQGVRTRADGSPLAIEFTVVSGWSDTMRLSQVAAQNLREVGLDVRIRSVDQGAWFANTFAGRFDLTTGWSNGGPTPYLLYKGLMSTRTVMPEGTGFWTNWHRYGSPAMDEVLRAFERTTDPVEQKALVSQMQHLFVAEAPAVPLFPMPVWGEFNSARFEGWPSASNPYAPLSPNPPYTPLLVLTQVRPRDLRSAAVLR